MGGIFIKHKIFIVAIILTAILCFSCITAKDTNSSETELELNSEDAQDLELSSSTDDDEDTSESSDEEILASGPSTDSDSSTFLVLDNDADKENVHIGDLVTWTISVINLGPNTAKNVKVNDQLPEGLKYVSHTTTKGTFDPITGIWNIGELLVKDGEVFLKIITKALTPGEKINKANLTTDSDNLNPESYEEEEIDVLEHEKAEVHAATNIIHPTGNPLVLVIVSLFAILVTGIRFKK